MNLRNPQNGVAYLHVGWPKTGSSSLQYFFALNVDQLNNAGINYPALFDLEMVRNSGYGQGNAYPLSYALLDNRSITNCPYPPVGLKKLREVLRQDKFQKNNVLLSTEWFTELSEKALINLKTCLTGLGYKVKIVGYLRSIMAFLNSEYAQQTKMGYLDEEADDWEASWKVPNQIALFETVFGHDAIVLRLFDTNVWAQGSLYRDALSTLGVDSQMFDDFVFPKISNASLSAPTINLQKALGLLGYALNEMELSAFETTQSSKSEFNSKTFWFSDKSVLTLRDKYQASVKELEKKYFDSRSILDDFQAYREAQSGNSTKFSRYSVEEVLRMSHATYSLISDKHGAGRANAFSTKMNNYLIANAQGFA